MAASPEHCYRRPVDMAASYSPPIPWRENRLRALEFRRPLWVPCFVRLANATWHKYREEAEELALRHPIIFGEYKRFERGNTDFDRLGPHDREGEYTDNWNCVWRNSADGLEGQVVGHPLLDWSALDSMQVPDPITEGDDGYELSWADTFDFVRSEKSRGYMTSGGCIRFFDRLHFLRGFDNLMVDFATDPPELHKLLDVLFEYNMKLINQWLKLGVDSIHSHGDIGTQTSLMISPATFRKYVKPYYKEMFGTCRKAGAHVYYSSDGNLLDIVDDLIECGVTMHDPQVRACTVNGIAKAYKGRLCACVDLDRQMLPFCSPADIRAHVEEIVRKVGSPDGGLMLLAWLTPDVPLENIEAICSAMEEFRTYWTN